MIKNWILAARPKTLTAALVPVVVATALVYGFYGVRYSYWMSLLALLSALFIQIATNLFNDAIDFKKGTDRNDRLGPKRVTQSGLMTYRQVMASAVFCCVVAIAAGAPLVYMGGWPILIVGIVSLMMAYSYTGGPFPLAYLGLGDLFVILFFGIIAVMGLVFLYLQKVTYPGLVSGLQVGLTSTVLIAINNLRDIHQDYISGKKTLAVRFGENFSKLEITLLYAISYLLGLYWMKVNFIWAALLPFLSLPVAIWIVFKLYKTPPSEIYNGFLAKAALTQVLFSLFLAAGLVLA